MMTPNSDSQLNNLLQMIHKFSKNVVGKTIDLVKMWPLIAKKSVFSIYISVVLTIRVEE